MQVDANGIRLEVERHGDPTAPAMILIRGLGSQLIHWPDNLIQGFVAEGFHVVTFDNRDTGLSSFCPKPGVPDDADTITALLDSGAPIEAAYTLEDMAQDVVGLMDALGLPRAHVFGISMGGMIGQIMLRDHADRLLSATLVMTQSRPLRREGAAELLARPQTRAEAQDKALAGEGFWGGTGFRRSEAEIMDEAGRAWDRAHRPDGANRQFLAILTGPDRRPGLASVTTPTLVIHGYEDTLLTEPMGAETAAHIPGSEYTPIAGMGHIITPSLAPLILARVSRFLRDRGLAP